MTQHGGGGGAARAPGPSAAPRGARGPAGTRTGWRRFVTRRNVGLAALGAFLVAVLGIGVTYAAITVPEPNELVRAQSTIVYWADGKTELGRFSAQNRESVDIDDIPQHARDAVLAAEDRNFYENTGISPVGIARAFYNNLLGDDVQGGSTITQQYVKNYYLTQERTYTRKIKEVFLAVKIDRQMDKDTILESYLNTIYFGRGAYGIQTAAQAYFRVPARELSAEQAAVLAAVIRSPGRYDPAQDEANQQRLADRFDYVVDGMVEIGALTEAATAGMSLPEIAPPPRGNRLAGPNGYLLETVRAELVASERFDDEEIDAGGLRVVSTFDRKAQRAAVEAVEEQVPEEGRPEDFHVGLAAIRPGTGEIVAMYGGENYLERQFNDAVQGRSQPGSTFKPFALAAALSDGISLDSRYDGSNNRVFPEYDNRAVPNFGGASYGMIDLVEATRNSVNTVYVDLTIDVGPDKVYEAARAAGIPEGDPDFRPTPSIVLGVANVSPVQVATAFATFAAEGVRARPHAVKEVRDPAGRVRYEPEAGGTRAFDAEVMADLTYALQQVVEGGSGERARDLGRPAAGKTGTTNEGRSVWFAGYTPQLAASVALWTEAPGASLAGLGGVAQPTGGRFPTMVWTAFMRAALEGTDVEQFPPRAGVGEVVNPVPTVTAEPTIPDTPEPTEAPTSTPTEEPTATPEPEPTATEPEPGPTESTPNPGRGRGRNGDDAGEQDAEAGATALPTTLAPT